MDETAEVGGTLDGTAGSSGTGAGESGEAASTGGGSSTGAVDGSTSDAGSTSSSTSTSGEEGTGTGFDLDACPSNLDPVCGKDGNTYDNACVATAMGVEIRRDGPCLGDCQGSCVVEPQAPSLLGLLLVVLVVIRPRRPRA